MNYNIIFGLDFLNQQKAHLDFETNSLQLQNGITEIPINPRKNKTHLVSTLCSVTLPPKAETILPVSVNSKGLPSQSKRCGLIEPAIALSSFNINGARCVIQGNDSGRHL